MGELGRFEEAYAHYQLALRLRPEDAETHNNLGAFFLKIRNDPQTAIAHLEKSLSFKQYYWETHNNLGIAYYRIGRLDEAAGHFRQAVRLEPGHANAEKNLKHVLERIEETEDRQ